MKIGDFARLGQVSVRMLRHYDTVGLLRPARVDPATGYRDYSPDQLALLHRIVVLKDLGLNLDQVAQLLDARLDPAELRGMLRLRRSELAVQLDQARSRLASVEHRLHLIEEENLMPDVECVLKSIPARRIAARTARVPENENVGDVVGPLFGEVAQLLSAAGSCPELGVGLYDMADGGMHVVAGYDYAGELGPAVEGLEIMDLPTEEQAVCAVHLGPTTGIPLAWDRLLRWSEQHGFEPSAPAREVYLEAKTDDQSDWVTELQLPVRGVG